MTTGLFIVDLQYLPTMNVDPQVGVFGQDFVQGIIEVGRYFLENSLPIYTFAYHEEPFIKAIETLIDEARIVRKRQWDGFSNPDLDEMLQKDAVSDIVLAGSHQSCCCHETGVSAVNRGYNVKSSQAVLFGGLVPESIDHVKPFYEEICQMYPSISELLHSIR